MAQTDDLTVPLRGWWDLADLAQPAALHAVPFSSSPSPADEHMARASESFTQPPPILWITTSNTHHEIRVSVPVVSLSLNLY